MFIRSCSAFFLHAKAGRVAALAEFARDSSETIVVVAGGALFTLPPAADDGVVKLQRR
jgi:hypothetical protein